MSETQAAPTLHLPAGMRYECIRCGRSCGEFWEIQVDPEMAAEIRARPREQLDGARDPREPIGESSWTPGQHVMRLDKGCCCLRSDDNLCTLHKAFGFDAKPNICRSFPYRFVETPGGAYVGLSFACTAVLGNLGPAVDGQRAELERLFGYTHSRRVAAAPIALTTDLPLSWEQYVGIEEDLAALLDPAWGPIGLRLRAQAIYLQLLVKLMRQERAQMGGLGAGPEFSEQAIAVARARMRGRPEDPWGLPLGLARKGRRSELVRRMVLGVAHSLRNTYGRRRGRFASYAAFMRDYARHALGRGVIDLPALPRAVRYRELRGVRLETERPEIDELLTRYFRHALHRKDLLMAENVQMGHQMQLLHWGLMEWYAGALAVVDGAQAVALGHLVEALRNVEKYYVFHTTFNRLFARYPLLRSFMDTLMGNPLYIVSVGRGTWEGRRINEHE
jgi:Fe-S-cluster containining protein